MKKLSIAFASQDWSKVNDFAYPNGCTWYRCVLPSAILKTLGHQCHVGCIEIRGNVLGVRLAKPLYNGDLFASGHKILVLKLPMHKVNLIATDMAKSMGIKVVVDVDDFFEGIPSENRASEITDPQKNPDNNRKIYFDVMEMADALVCSTSFLFDFYSRKYPKKPVFLVRNSVDTKRWEKTKKKRSAPVVGWVGATPWRANDLEQLAPFIDDYLITRNLKFHHSGNIPNATYAKSAAEALGIGPERFSSLGMAPMTDLPRLFLPIDIGIVPLSDIPFNHAKSYLKGLEYSIAGIPFIASRSPEYELLADAGVGRIATSGKQWVSHLDELLNYKVREDEADLNMDIVKNHFSIESFAGAWETTYTQIMDA